MGTHGYNLPSAITAIAILNVFSCRPSVTMIRVSLQMILIMKGILLVTLLQEVEMKICSRYNTSTHVATCIKINAFQ